MRSTLCALFACISVAVMVVASLILFQREAIYYPDERQYSIQTPAEVTDAQAPNEQSTAEISMDLLPPPSNGGNQEGWEEEEQFRRGERVPQVLPRSNCLKKNQTTPRPPEHPPVMLLYYLNLPSFHLTGENVENQNAHTYSQSMDQSGKIASPRSCLRIWSREAGSAVPSRVSLLIFILRLNLVLTYGIPPELRGGVYLVIYNRHTPSGQSRVYRVTQLRTDGVHCRESAGTGPVNLKVVPNECCLGRSPWTK